MNAKAILICGKICSGKSTYAEKLRKSNGAVLLSVDEITLALFDENIGEKHDEVVAKTQQYLFAKGQEIIEAGKSVIFDWGFWTKKERGEASRIFAEKNIPVEWHYIDVSDETWQAYWDKRNAAVRSGEKKFYFIDNAVARKFSTLFEAPSRNEIDFWITNNPINSES